MALLFQCDAVVDGFRPRDRGMSMSNEHDLGPDLDLTWDLDLSLTIPLASAVILNLTFKCLSQCSLHPTGGNQPAGFGQSINHELVSLH